MEMQKFPDASIQQPPSWFGAFKISTPGDGKYGASVASFDVRRGS